MATIVYLDVEDEITSAAARIRAAADKRVALVVPFGSRVATSRINFRLLAREAMVNEQAARHRRARRLGEGARGIRGDPGLRLGGGVRGGPRRAAGATTTATRAPVPGPPPQRPPAAGAGAAADDRGPLGNARSRPSARPARPRCRPDRTPADEAELEAVVHRSREVPVVKPRRRRPGARAGGRASSCSSSASPSRPSRASCSCPPRTSPSRPRSHRSDPIELTVRADPSATAVDPVNAVIPAQTVTIPVTVSGDFPATGVRTVTTPAKGAVRWKNCDPSSSYTIPKGTVVSTTSGIAVRRSTSRCSCRSP